MSDRVRRCAPEWPWLGRWVRPFVFVVVACAAGCSGSEDAEEGPRAFAEKRNPYWQGA